MQAYIDDSMTKGAVLVFAGYVASVEDWEAFSAEWQRRLDDAHLPVFKMAEIGSDPKSWELAGYFYRAIEERAKAFLAVAVELEPLKRLVDEFFVIQKGGEWIANPYSLAFRAIFDFTAQYQHELGITEPIDFIFDDRGEKNVVREGFAYFKACCREDLKDRLGAEPRFENDRRFPPLQAADMLAWLTRRHWLQHGSIVHPPLAVPWKRLRAIPGNLLDMNDEEIKRFLVDFRDRIDARENRQKLTMTVSFSCDLSLLDGEQ
jgi:hypothetical protein